MKVCPICQASFAEGFVFCPRDAERLVPFDLRAQLRARQLECNFLLEAESFTQRLWRVLREAWRDLRADPRAFCTAFWRGEGSSRRRKQMLQAGVALGLIAYCVVVTGLMLIGLQVTTTAEALAEKNMAPDADERSVRIVFPVQSISKSDFTRGRNGHLGGSLPQPQRAQGGGGNQGNQASSASRGAPPASLNQPLLAPNLDLPKLSHPDLIMPATVLADPRSMPLHLPLGDVSGVPAPPSAGRGLKNGIGDDGTGPGAGSGNGPGAGPGRDGGIGGNRFTPPGGRTTGVGDNGDIPMATSHLSPRILYKEKARYSEEARQQKVQGPVILLATFTADGRITDIRVVRGQPYGLTEEAIQAAKRIRFQPALQNGVAVTVRAHLEYNFALY